MKIVEIFHLNSYVSNAWGRPPQQNTTYNAKVEQGEYNPHSVYCDGTRLFVSDTASNRVLVWNSIPTSNGQAASFVLGQSSFLSHTANAGGISGATMNLPAGVFGDGTRLFVADSGNNRVLVWNALPTGMGQTASFALGQPNLT
jgi:DNA-binding beta-propeller fold protein YncE